jgi:hypothetical protein
VGMVGDRSRAYLSEDMSLPTTLSCVEMCFSLTRHFASEKNWKIWVVVVYTYQKRSTFAPSSPETVDSLHVNTTNL